MYWSKLTRLFGPGRHMTRKATNSIINSTSPGTAALFLTTAAAKAGAAPTPVEEEKPARAKIDLDFLIKNSDLPHWVHSPIDFDLYKAKSLDELFAVVDRYRLDGLQASAFFTRLTKFTPVNTLKLALDTRFKFCYDVFLREANAMPLSQILVALRSLLLIGFPSDHTICIEIHDVIQNRLTKDSSLPLSALVSFACFHIDYDTGTSSSNQKSNFQKSLEDVLLSKMALIHDLNSILLMMKKLSKNNDNKYNKIDKISSDDQTIHIGHSLLHACEDRALDLLDSATAEDLVNILQCEAAVKSRNLLLIKAAVQKLDAVQEQLGLKKAVTVLTSLNSLNYFTKSIVSKIFVDLTVILDYPSDTILLDVIVVFTSFYCLFC
uniref:FAST kinase leucine-rich domain-containing protein n=1 Tax=Romanomermis culicivorax TaxID=13658 RepID=A0A915KDH4_ROMCU